LVCCVAADESVTELAGQTKATAKLTVPLGSVSVTAPDVSVAGAKGAEPIWVAMAVGAGPVTVKVIVAGGGGGGGLPPPPLLVPPPEPPPHPEIKRNTRAKIETRDIMQNIRILLPKCLFQ
jgi:hypothetical protein